MTVLTRLTPFKRLVAAGFRLLFRAVARVRVEGLEHVPRSGPLLIVANHTTIADPPFVAAWLQPALGRPIQFMAKEQLFSSPMRPLLRAFGAVRVRAGGSDVEAYRAGVAITHGGGVLGLFPEGTRSRDGVMAEPHAGVALLAARSGVPVLPVGVSGGQRLLPLGARLPRLGVRMRLRVGEPFTVTLDRGLDRRAATRAAADRIMGSIAKLVDPEQRGRFG
ncbi:MAG: lysophospholipid acyltransferase family protein [Gaiellales bacterium]